VTRLPYSSVARLPLAALALLVIGASGARAQAAPLPCLDAPPLDPRRHPTENELRCRFRALGPGRFGLLSYVDVPVYQPATPMPGTHIVGVLGHARPAFGESYEQWEWRMLRTEFGASGTTTHRGLELLDPVVAERVRLLERLLAERGVRAARRETWRAPQRQAYLFQQGRSRPGPLATTTLTSWHSRVDSAGGPAGRAVDYEVPSRHLRRFHEVVREAGLQSFGADSNDPGHVFLPDDAVPEEEIILLRLLPRVPEVTLATGLPVDRDLPPGGRAALRAAAQAFARESFLPRPVPALAPLPLAVRMIGTGGACALTLAGSPSPAGDGGAGCAPRRSAAFEPGRAGRNTGGSGGTPAIPRAPAQSAAEAH
jgi:hypothetical protein